MDFLGDVWSWFTDSKQWSGNSSIPNRLYEHVKMSLVAVALAIGAGLPVALWLGHKRRFGWLAINVSNVGRAVPSFAILLGQPLATRVIDAMPIVIASNDYEGWLDPKVSPDRALEICTSPAISNWRTDAVSTRMSSSQYDDERCIAPLGNPNQRELF